MRHLAIDAGNLNTAQQEKLLKLDYHNIYKSIHFVETLDPEEVQENGLLKLDLPFVECSNLRFTVANVDKSDDNNYQWYGKTVENPDDELDSLCSSGSLTIMKTNGLIIGHITLDNRSFELYDLTGGIQALCETDLTLFSAEECATDSEPVSGINYRTTADEPCEPVTTKVLVLFTPAAAALETDMTGKANLAISQINNIWANSGIDNRLILASVQPLNFTESNTQDIIHDREQLANNPTVQVLRSAHLAEIVVLFTAPSYGNTKGIVRAIGGTSADAYAIVEVTSATTGRFTFAHEICHLYGARHNRSSNGGNDNTPGDAHGYQFLTGGWPFRTDRFTLMAVLVDGSRIEHVSNPDIEFRNKPTGTASNENNARNVNALKFHVANFYTEPVLPLQTSLAITYQNTCRDYGRVKATVSCGSFPTTYQWFASDEGFTWFNYGVGYGNSNEIGYTIPAPTTGNYKARFIKVIVTDGNNHSVTARITVTRRCTTPGDPDIGLRAQKAESIKATKVFPNPNSGNFTVILPENTTGSIKILLKDLSGKTVANLYEGQADKKEKSLNLKTGDSYFRGLYILQIDTAGKTEYQKVVLE